MDCIPWNQEIYDTGPVPCPQCGKAVEDFTWLYQGKYYCRIDHVPVYKGRGPQSVYPATPRTSTGSIDWERYYEGFYGVPPHARGPHRDVQEES